ncbi:MAG TPA: ABC transporter permease [Bacilli bacterium]|nr:ABC transporter permease [Bacilli bacterium]
MNTEKVKKRFTDIFNAFTPSVISIIGGLLIGFVILFIVSPGSSGRAFGTLIAGSFLGGISGIGDALYKMSAITLTGLSVAFAFKTGLFNIGASGQMLFSGAVTILVGQINGIPPSIHWLVALLAGTLAGAFWGFIPGLLKALFNVNEVVATIMMNYTAVSTASLLMVKVAHRDATNYAKVNQSAYLPKMGLDKIFSHTPMIDISIFIAIIAAIVVYFILNKTTLGFQLKAVGYNRDASKYAGINEKRNIIISMTIAGALSGLAGATFYLGGTKMGTAPNLIGEGFIGITVALLANSHPLGILASAYFIAHLSYGGSMIVGLGYFGEIASIVTACIVYFMGIAVILQNNAKRIWDKIKEATVKIKNIKVNATTNKEGD